MSMRNYIKTTLVILSIYMVAGLSSCSCQDDLLDNIQDNNNEWLTCELTLNITRAGFSDEPQSRAGNQWVNESKIFLTFSTGQFVSYGYATYNNGSWALNYNGKLVVDNSTTCSAVFIDDADSDNGAVVNLTPQSVIYQDDNCSCSYQNGKLSIGANLKPKTGRIRFSGSNGDKITVYGITHYSSYDYASGKFHPSNVAITTTVSSNFTPYIYGGFSDADKPRLNLITANSAYTRFPSNSMYKPGDSGYMSIPSESSHSLWTNAAVFKVNGVEFTMIPVEYKNGNFLLAETETTEELYDAIMGGNSRSQLPKNDIRSWEMFLSKLNALTGLEFRIPSEREWQYAFVGGNKTHGYIYSGSNIIDNVAWYKDNSGGIRHDVKLLQPNELGFYDMSGNVGEVVLVEGSAAADYYEFHGGYWDSNENQCLKSSHYASGYSAYGGLRFALSN